jgi:hypothetical protein
MSDMIFSDKAKAAIGAMAVGEVNPFYRENGVVYMRVDAVEFGPAPDNPVYKTPRKRISLYFDQRLMATMDIDNDSEKNSVRLVGLEGRMKVQLS